MNKQFGTALSIFFLLAATKVSATSYPVPPSSESLIGQERYASASFGESVVNFQQRYDIGYNAIENANPHLDVGKGFYPGSAVKLPTQHLLPNLPRQGIVINLPEMRMYYYPIGSNKVLTYPIGIGKIGKTIPITMTSITRKTKNPVWIPPEDIREFNLQQGVVLPAVMPPGPENPLGPFAIYMRVPTYLIHSTIFPESIGKRASFGCIRMYESDIKEFFPSVRGGIPVAIINTPVKIGWQNHNLYIEAHKALEEHGEAFESSLPGMIHQVSKLTQNHKTLVDWQALEFIAKERDGVPHEIGMKITA